MGQISVDIVCLRGSDLSGNQQFDNLAEAKRLIEVWRIDYNVSRPHMGIGNITPREYDLQVELLEQNIGSDAVRN
jgi:hypothetical protein